MACRVAHARVRDAHHHTLKDLIYKLFERRHHDYVGGQEKDWLTMELIQSLRRESEIYREELSTQTSGPLPFAIGYFRLQGKSLRLTTDEVPANVEGRTLVRLLSEFLEPGARFWFGAEGNGWEIQGPDEVVALDPEPQDLEEEQKN
ncbi:MAG: hypothetical protein ACLFTE_02360 [Salinivenus sp.]